MNRLNQTIPSIVSEPLQPNTVNTKFNTMYLVSDSYLKNLQAEEFLPGLSRSNTRNTGDIPFNMTFPNKATPFMCRMINKDRTVCGLFFNSVHELRIHQETNHQGLMCQLKKPNQTLCGETFDSLEELNKHQQNTQHSNAGQTSMPPPTTSNSIDNSVNNPTQFQYWNSNAKNTASDILREQLNKAVELADQRTSQLIENDKSLNDKTKTEALNSIKKNPLINTYSKKCHICNFKAKTPLGLSKHIQQVHVNSAPDPFLLKPLKRLKTPAGIKTRSLNTVKTYEDKDTAPIRDLNSREMSPKRKSWPLQGGKYREQNTERRSRISKPYERPRKTLAGFNAMDEVARRQTVNLKQNPTEPSDRDKRAAKRNARKDDMGKNQTSPSTLRVKKTSFKKNKQKPSKLSKKQLLKEELEELEKQKERKNKKKKVKKRSADNMNYEGRTQGRPPPSKVARLQLNQSLRLPD